MWTDGFQQSGVDGKQYAGYGAWFGEGHALNFSAPLQGSLQTDNRGELTAAIEVLKLAADNGAAALRRLTAGHRRGHTVARRLEEEGWKTAKGQTIKNIDVWHQMDD